MQGREDKFQSLRRRRLVKAERLFKYERCCREAAYRKTLDTSGVSG